MSDKNSSFIADIINEKSDLLRELSTYIWNNPETRFEEYKSAARLKEALRAEEFIINDSVAGIDTAFSGTFSSAGGGPVIGILGEFDALAGLSQAALLAEKKAVIPNGNGHGCGHNLLGTGSLGAALAVKEFLKHHNIPGTVIYYGCPGEEGGSGKTFMAREGVFDDLDIALCWHPSPVNAIMSLRTLANYQVYFRFKGISSHAAMSPELGRSALDAVELMNVGVNYLREHMEDTARIHYAVTNTGGVSPNVVQADAEVLYLVRAETLEKATALLERVKKIAKGAALMTETACEVIFNKACSDYLPNRELEKIMFSKLKTEEKEIQYTDDEYQFANAMWDSFTQEEKENAIPQLKNFGVMNDSGKLSGLRLSNAVHNYTGEDGLWVASTDVADVSRIVPVAQCTCTTSAIGTSLHTWQMVAQGLASYALKGTLRAARVMAGTAAEVLTHPEKLVAIKQEHEETQRQRPYTNPIPDNVKPSRL